MNQTWSNVQEMQRAIRLLQQENPHFMWQHEDNSYYPCHHVEQLARYQKDIFEGLKTPGFFPIRIDNLTRWGALDFDNHDGRFSRNYWRDDARNTFDRLSRRFEETWLEESSKGSFHVWAIKPELVPARDLRQILRECARDHPNIEIYPKQNELVHGKRMGNCLRFPGRHQHRHSWSKFIARQGRIEEVLALPLPKGKKWEEPSGDQRFWSLYAVVTRGLVISGSGQRNDVMKRIVGRLKGRTLSEDVAVGVHDRFYDAFAEHILTKKPESREKFLTWFRKAAPCDVRIPDYPLMAAERANLNSLPEHLHDTVLVLLRAKKHSDKTGQEFYMSSPKLAAELEVCITTAHNRLRECIKLKIIERLATGYTGVASTYKPGSRWIE